VITHESGATFRTRANATGGFALGNVPPGHCRIDVSASGFQTASTEFEMGASGGVWVNVTLARGGGGIIVVPLPY